MPRDSREDFSPFSVTAADFLNSSLSPLIDTGWQGTKDTIFPLFLLTHHHSFQVSRLHLLYSAILLTISFCLLPFSPHPHLFSSQLSPSPSEFSPVELSVSPWWHTSYNDNNTHSVLIPAQPPSDPGFLTLSLPTRLLLPYPVSCIHSLPKNCFCSQPPSTQSPMGCVINSSSTSLFLPLLHISAPLDEFSEEGIRIPCLDLHSSAPWSPCEESTLRSLSFTPQL